MLLDYRERHLLLTGRVWALESLTQAPEHGFADSKHSAGFYVEGTSLPLCALGPKSKQVLTGTFRHYLSGMVQFQGPSCPSPHLQLSFPTQLPLALPLSTTTSDTLVSSFPGPRGKLSPCGPGLRTPFKDPQSTCPHSLLSTCLCPSPSILDCLPFPKGALYFPTVHCFLTKCQVQSFKFSHSA